jgi:hypothetical protein
MLVVTQMPVIRKPASEKNQLWAYVPNYSFIGYPVF